MRDSGGFAQVCDMEPGMFFRERSNRTALTFVGVAPVASRFAGKRRVRVLTEQGVSWVVDRDERFPLLTSL